MAVQVSAAQDNNQWFYLYEVPEANPALAGWTTFTPWAHGNYVYGNSVAPQVVAIADNLDLLAATVNYHNFPAPNDAGAGLVRLPPLALSALPHLAAAYEDESATTPALNHQ